MESPLFKPLGTPVEQLDTPVLVVDLTTMERNLETLHSFFRSSHASARPNVTTHKCPAVAHLQLAAGGTVGGISVSGIDQAEVFAHAGITDILVANEIVTGAKIKRLCSLARTSRLMVAVDNPKNVHDLCEAAQASGAALRVLVDINTDLARSGVQPGTPALGLAKDVVDAQGLRFAGLMTCGSAVLGNDYQELVASSSKVIQAVLDTRELIEGAGIDVEIVSVDGTLDYESAGFMEGVTEVRLGTYPLMDYSYYQYQSRFEPAAKVLSTVISHPTPSLAVADAGHKAIGPDRGLPFLEATPGARVTRLSAEHSVLELEGEARDSIDVGTKVWLTPWDLGLCVNQYNYFHAVRDGKLDAVWEISARGRFG